MRTLTIVLLAACVAIVCGYNIPKNDAKQYHQFHPHYNSEQPQKAGEYYSVERYQKIAKKEQQLKEDPITDEQNRIDENIAELNKKLAFFDNVKMDVRTIEDERKSGSDNPSGPIVFTLYVKDQQPHNLTVENLADSPFQLGWETSMYIPSEQCDNVNRRELEFARKYENSRKNVNFIGVDWLQVQPQQYEPRIKFVANKVARALADMIKAIQVYDNSSSTHLIGHGLGAHIAGVASRVLEKKVDRITGLDPSGAGFSFGVYNEYSLCRHDSKRVDVIYTNYDKYGMSRPIGQANIFVNGGVEQPCCKIQSKPGCSSYNNTCSHEYAVDVYIWSIDSPASSDRFTALKCASYLMLKKQQCNQHNSLKIVIGEFWNPQESGTYMAEIPCVIPLHKGHSNERQRDQSTQTGY